MNLRQATTSRLMLVVASLAMATLSYEALAASSDASRQPDLKFVPDIEKNASTTSYFRGKAPPGLEHSDELEQHRRLASGQLSYKLNTTGPSKEGTVNVPIGPNLCFRTGKGRGVGTVLTAQCNAEEELNGALCYLKCRSGYSAVGCCVCRKKGCPEGFKDDGAATCLKPQPYGRGAGYPWKLQMA